MSPSTVAGRLMPFGTLQRLPCLEIYLPLLAKESDADVLHRGQKSP
jgi:hypothetical protein